jgi:membrane-associated HD superfamily phosphohydrolase
MDIKEKNKIIKKTMEKYGVSFKECVNAINEMDEKSFILFSEYEKKGNATEDMITEIRKMLEKGIKVNKNVDINNNKVREFIIQEIKEISKPLANTIVFHDMIKERYKNKFRDLMKQNKQIKEFLHGDECLNDEFLKRKLETVVYNQDFHYERVNGLMAETLNYLELLIFFKNKSIEEK